MLDPKHHVVVRDFLLELGVDETTISFALEALGIVGKAKRRELRLLRMYVEAIARIARQSWEGDDMNRVLDLTEEAQGPGHGLAAPEWADRRRLAKLRAGGHSDHCASRIIWTGECECSIGDAKKVGRLPVERTITGWLHGGAERAAHRATVDSATACAHEWVNADDRCRSCGADSEERHRQRQAATFGERILPVVISSGADLPFGALVMEDGQPATTSPAARQCVLCGKPATRECPELFQFHCGAPLCATCEHHNEGPHCACPICGLVCEGCGSNEFGKHHCRRCGHT